MNVFMFDVQWLVEVQSFMKSWKVKLPQQSEHLISSNVIVSIQIVNAKTKSSFFSRCSFQKDRKSTNPSFKSQWQAFKTFVPSAKYSLHQRFFGYDIKRWMKQFTEYRSIDSFNHRVLFVGNQWVWIHCELATGYRAIRNELSVYSRQGFQLISKQGDERTRTKGKKSLAEIIIM